MEKLPQSRFLTKDSKPKGSIVSDATKVGKSIIKNRDILHFTYMPDIILHRKNEQENLRLLENKHRMFPKFYKIMINPRQLTQPICGTMLY